MVEPEAKGFWLGGFDRPSVFELGPWTEMRNRFFHGTMTLISLGFVVVSAWGLRVTQIHVLPDPLLSKTVLLLLLILGAAFYRWRNEEKLLNILLLTFWAVLFSTLHLFPMFIAARRRVAMSDSLLAQIDRLMGLEVPQVLVIMERYPALRNFLAFCYNTLIVLMTVAIIAPPLYGKMRAAKEFAIAGVVSAILSFPLFAVFQAVGPWTYYKYKPQIDQGT